jgi:ABC-type cobalamin/Fe3+-siderophores transport system ATPase subunit
MLRVDKPNPTDAEVAWVKNKSDDMCEPIYYSPKSEISIEKVYNYNSYDTNTHRTDTIYVNPNEKIIIPTLTDRKNQRDYIVMTGQSGCGKTTMLRQYMDVHTAMYPSRRKILISNKDVANDTTDPCHGIDGVEVIPRNKWISFFADYIGPPPRSNVSGRSKTVNKPIVVPSDPRLLCKHSVLKSVDEFKDSIIAFDDIQNVSPECLEKFMHEVLNNFVMMGRSSRINVILCNHIVGEYRYRLDIQEATHLIVFPRTMSQLHLRSIFKRSLQMDDDKFLLEKYQSEQWLAIIKQQPPIFMTETSIEVIKL